jgi:Fe2+ or Zn2+ uptake regulation protein
VADLNDNQGLSALDELLTRGLLQETGGRCFFAHDSIRTGAYAEAGEIRRRVLHRRAIETLQEAIASKYGYELRSHKHEMYGVCPTCQKKSKKANPRN